MKKSRSSDLEENDIAKGPPIRCPSLPTPLKAFSPNAPCPSPPSKGAEERKLCGSRGTTQLKFGIDNILQPDFGGNSTERFSPPQFPAIPPEICCLSSMLPPSGLHSHELLPSWIFCTRYSDRPSSGPRIRKIKRREFSEEEKRPRTAFTADQLERLKSQFLNNRYLTEKRRQELAHELGLNESQIKIWFQNKRAKLKKSSQRAHQSAAVLHQFMAHGGGGIYQQK